MSVVQGLTLFYNLSVLACYVVSGRFRVLMRIPREKRVSISRLVGQCKSVCNGSRTGRLGTH